MKRLVVVVDNDDDDSDDLLQQLCHVQTPGLLEYAHSASSLDVLKDG